MKLKDTNTIWGIPISIIKERARLYRKWVSLMYLFDIFVITIVTTLLFQSNMGFQWYVAVIVVFAILCNIIITSVSNASKYEAFKFFKSNRNCNIIEKQFSISNEQLYSVLYCVGYKRLKVSKTSHEYCDSLCSLCCEDKYNAKKIMKYLNKYAVSDDSSENITLKCQAIKRGRKEYLVDITFCIDENTSYSEKENNTDADN